MTDISAITTVQRARIVREERDALMLAWQKGQLTTLLDAEQFLNRRIEDLGVDTMTGDTSEEN